MKSERGTGGGVGLGEELGLGEAIDGEALVADGEAAGAADGVWVHPVMATGRSATTRTQLRLEAGDTG